MKPVFQVTKGSTKTRFYSKLIKLIRQIQVKFILQSVRYGRREIIGVLETSN